MIELKRCPFCGGKARLGGSDNVNGEPYWYITCEGLEKCGANQFGSSNKDDVIARWNRRAYESPESKTDA